MGSETRHITLRDGVRSQVTVIARLVSDDTEAGQESACLVLRFDCAVSRRRPARVVTVRARSLHAVDEHALRRLAEDGVGSGADQLVRRPARRWRPKSV